MNFNDNPEKLKEEEQAALNNVINSMDQVLDELDKTMQEYVREAKNIDCIDNPDQYYDWLMTKKGMKDTAETREAFWRSRDELYDTHLLLQYQREGESEVRFKECKVGLHDCNINGHQYVVSWKVPVFRHYVIDDSSDEYEDTVEEKYGREYHNIYNLIAKNSIKLRFTHIKNAISLYPNAINEETLELMKGKGFFSDAFLDEMIEKIKTGGATSVETDVSKMIYDEFLIELASRRSTSDFVAIVFSIQKMQSKIIQSPYERNMIVQGCAGSGKSMIMLHRLPLLLYDRAKTIHRTDLYIITPSQMYIQMAERMRGQLEISDINMGTLEQYYDYCIEKYAGHQAEEYGDINYSISISKDHEKYIYSEQCRLDIQKSLETYIGNEVPLEKAYATLRVKAKYNRIANTYSQKIGNRLLQLQEVMDANYNVLTVYHKAIRKVLDALYAFSRILSDRKAETLQEIRKSIDVSKKEVTKAQNELNELDVRSNALAVQNRNNLIEAAQNRIKKLEAEIKLVEEDDAYFALLLGLNEKIKLVVKDFTGLKNEFRQDSVNDTYNAIDKIGPLIGGYYMLAWEFSRVEEKYAEYLGSLNDNVQHVGDTVNALQEVKGKYLSFDYFSQISNERERLTHATTDAVKEVYEQILGKIGINPNEKGEIAAIKCSPYLYLQVIYSYQGAPSKHESVLAIDEAQGIAPEEIRLLKNINDGNVVFNLYGDVNQHIEGTKGVDQWEDFNRSIDYDSYEMLENYRNAESITNYCNQKLNMNMKAFSIPGSGVHELNTEEEFNSNLKRLLQNPPVNVFAAILVKTNDEAQEIKKKFSAYKQNINDMTSGETTLQYNCWNLMTISDAKGLEFNTVVVLNGRMSKNEQYIAFTRALDELYIYQKEIYIPISSNVNAKSAKEKEIKYEGFASVFPFARNNSTKQLSNSKVNNDDNQRSDYSLRNFFENNGLEVVDNRSKGGPLWVVGKEDDIKEIVNRAVEKYSISGKYAIGKAINYKEGWYTKSNR